LEIGKVYRSENVVLVSRDFLEKTVTEKTLMVRDINYLLMNKSTIAVELAKRAKQ